MTTQQHADEQSSAQGTTGTAVKRRGLIAGVAALAAGLLATRSATPVGATSGTGFDGTLVMGSNSGNFPNYAREETMIATGVNYGLFGTAPPSLFAAEANTNAPFTIPHVTGIYANARGGGAGVLGVSGATTVSTYPPLYPAPNAGVYGYGVAGHVGMSGLGTPGVLGQGLTGTDSGVVGRASTAGSGSVPAYGVVGLTPALVVPTTGEPAAGTAGFSNVAGVVGVYGHATVGDTNGVQGSGANGGAGVYGINSNAVGIGVQGFNDHGPAVQGNTSEGVGVKGIAGTNGVGVRGMSATGFGVVGQTSGTGVVAGVSGTSTTAYGIIGSTTASGYSGLTAITSTSGVAAMGATSTVPDAYAAFFTGTTIVNGNFVATGGSKSAAVKDATGQHRLVYCVESPESWFEDFGEAKLVDGKAAVALDKTFAEIVHTDTYHVFLTEYGATNHVFVANRTASGFVVQSEKAGASGQFSYRVVAKRKDIVGERLAKFDMPKINHPDPDKLPKPETPKKP